MEETLEINQGEVKIKISADSTGKITFAELGLQNEDLILENGLLRLVFDFENLANHKFYQVPTIEVTYNQEVGETHWQCDFNDVTILDKLDHHGSSTVLLLNRKTISGLEHRHENTLIVHAEFPQSISINTSESYIRLF